MSISPETALRLNELTSAFYTEQAESFSATRQAPWHGWEQALAVMEAADPSFVRRPLKIMDLGCGNLRFEKFLAQHLQEPFEAWAADSCDALMRAAVGDFTCGAPASLLHLTHLDLVRALMSAAYPGALSSEAVREANSALANLPLCDLTVAFGFAHHLATPQLRAELLRELAAHTAPGGFMVISFWQFLRNERLRAKAEETTRQACEQGIVDTSGFQSGDYLLGWQHSDALRFCHHTSESEITELVQTLPGDFREIARFLQDGKSHDLNCYVVIRRTR